MKYVLILVAACFLMTGCGGSQSGIEEAVGKGVGKAMEKSLEGFAKVVDKRIDTKLDKKLEPVNAKLESLTAKVNSLKKSLAVNQKSANPKNLDEKIKQFFEEKMQAAKLVEEINTESRAVRMKTDEELEVIRRETAKRLDYLNKALEAIAPYVPVPLPPREPVSPSENPPRSPTKSPPPSVTSRPYGENLAGTWIVGPETEKLLARRAR